MLRNLYLALTSVYRHPLLSCVVPLCLEWEWRTSLLFLPPCSISVNSPYWILLSSRSDPEGEWVAPFYTNSNIVYFPWVVHVCAPGYSEEGLACHTCVNCSLHTDGSRERIRWGRGWYEISLAVFHYCISYNEMTAKEQVVPWWHDVTHLWMMYIQGSVWVVNIINTFSSLVSYYLSEECTMYICVTISYPI